MLNINTPHNNNWGNTNNNHSPIYLNNNNINLNNNKIFKKETRFNKFKVNKI